MNIIHVRHFAGGIVALVEVRRYPVNLYEPSLHREVWDLTGRPSAVRQRGERAYAACREYVLKNGYAETAIISKCLGAA